jgi:serine/threonine-protein kinase
MSQSQDDNQPLFGTSGPLGTRLQNDAAIPQEQILQGLRSVKEFNENYTDLTPIGQGGMGQVFQAWDQRFERFVAIKQILTSSVGDPSAVSRFLREGRIVGAFNHPNIIIVYDRGESPLGPYLVMEFASGGNLASLCEKGPLDVKSVVEYGMQICEALTCIHNAGIIHRDIKPQNILLQPYRLNQPI